MGAGTKFISWGEVHRSVEKGNFEGKRVRHIAFPSETYTYREENVYVSSVKCIRFGAGSFTSHAERLLEEEKHTLPFPCITSPTGVRTTSWRHLK